MSWSKVTGGGGGRHTNVLTARPLRPGCELFQLQKSKSSQRQTTYQEQKVLYLNLFLNLFSSIIAPQPLFKIKALLKYLAEREREGEKGVCAVRKEGSSEEMKG